MRLSPAPAARATLALTLFVAVLAAVTMAGCRHHIDTAAQADTIRRYNEDKVSRATSETLQDVHQAADAPHEK